MQLMKRTTISLALGAILTLSACSEYDFDSKYEDPSKVTTVSISNLMVGVFQRVKDYDLYEYNRFFGFDSQFVGKYAQTFGYTYSSSMYTPGYIPYIDSQWDNLYSALTQLRKLESLYNEESAGQQEQDEAFLLAARLQVYDFLLLLLIYSVICPSAKHVPYLLLMTCNNLTRPTTKQKIYTVLYLPN